MGYFIAFVYSMWDAALKREPNTNQQIPKQFS